MEMDFPKLKAWFNSEKRDLPWRHSPTPYSIWISEVMLQQTQASVVASYFLRWMERFPTIESLAKSSIEEVIKLWEGLGYYSRARYIHAGAKYIVEHFNAEIPNTDEDLKKIKGLGPYTRGAILSFAFHQKKAAVDGNVLRVLARYFQIEEDIKKPAIVKIMQEMAQNLLPDYEPWVINEALIELGATICQKRPNCSICPIRKSCKGYINQKAEFLPIKSKGPKTEHLSRFVAVINYENHYLLRKGKKGEIMEDLHEFPYFETPTKGISLKQFKNEIFKNHGIDVEKVNDLPIVSHSFTRYQVKLTPVLFNTSNKIDLENFIWVPRLELIHLPFSSGHRRVLGNLLQSTQ